MSERHKYWTELPSTKHQFFKVMMGNFRNELRLPRKFMRCFREELPDTIKLRGPSNNVWDVKLEMTSRDTYIRDGWDIFASNHYLQEYDFLTFCYCGNFTFHVTVFDKSACEREACHFLKKPDESEHDSEDSLIVLESGEDWIHKNKRKHVLIAEEENEETSYCCYFVSNRRDVSEEEKQRALKLASAFSSDHPYFRVVMKPTHVYKYFFMKIHKKWAREHLPNTDMKIHLTIPTSDKLWTVNFKYKQSKCGLGGGWSKFVMDNNLEQDDVCIFELKQDGKSGKKAIIFNVLIFRVVYETIPKIRVNNRRPQLKALPSSCLSAKPSYH